MAGESASFVRPNHTDMRLITLATGLLLSIGAFSQAICEQLTAGFAWGPPTGSDAIQFSNTTTGTGETTVWQWSFGDGATSGDAQPLHEFPGAGTYEVCLTAISVFILPSGESITCVDEYCAPVVIGGGGSPCNGFEAGFTWTATASGNGVLFSNGTTGTGFQTTWQWIFGDGTTSTEAQPDHGYAEPGTYTVCLVATTVFETSSGLLTCVDEYCAPVVIGGGSSPCDGFEAGFTWTATASGNGVLFSNGTMGTGFQTTWQWIFGDGTTSTEAQPDHGYAAPGTYTVCLVATTVFETPAGLITCVDEYCVPVTVGGVNNCAWLSAAFTWGAGANGVEFVYQPQAPSGVQLEYLWAFGDGTTATTQNAFHVYTASGTYEVCHTVTAYASNGTVLCTATSCQAVSWQGGSGSPCDGFEAGFTWTTTASGNGVLFSNGTTGTGSQTTWQWSFGDGATNSEAQPDHGYAAPGTYTVCLVATTVFETSSGLLTCVDEYCAPVVIGGEPEECDPSFALEINSEPSGAGFILAASTNLPNNGITWSFDNGLVLYGSSIQVDLSSVLNIELCISAWYQPNNASDTCWATVCGLLSELGFAVNVGQLDGEVISVWPNPATDFLFVGTGRSGAQARVTIYGSDGRIEREVSVSGEHARVDLSGLAPGLKSIAVSGRVERFKLVKE